FVLLLLGAHTAFPQASQRPDQRAREVLAEGSSHKDPDVRLNVAAALSLISSRDPSANLLDKLAVDKDHLVREAAITTIGELRDVKRVKLVNAALEDEVPEVVFAAARSLYAMKQPRGRAVLLSIV